MKSRTKKVGNSSKLMGMNSMELHLQNPRFFVLPLLLLLSFFGGNARIIDVGLILDLESGVGKMTKTCMDMAVEDFYKTHNNYTTRILLHPRDSMNDSVNAASAAIDLLKNVQVQAILGPLSSTQADFVIDIGTKVQVPIVSGATSPLLSPKESPYFVRASQNTSSQAEAIAAIVSAFSWREVVFIYENNEYGLGIGPYLSSALHEVSATIPYRSVLPPSCSDDRILQELYKLKTMQTRVFVVHVMPNVAMRLFLKAKEAGMMNKGYAWIITDVITSFLGSFDSTVIDSMQGVLGVRPYVPKSSELNDFTKRWEKRFRLENPDMDRIELNVHGLWAYDTITALAVAVERAGIAQPSFNRPDNKENFTDLAAIGTSETGLKLLQLIQKTRLKGLSGDFHIVDGQLQSLVFQIVNVIGKGEREIGLWTRMYGISDKLEMPGNKNYNTNMANLRAIIWPGESHEQPRGWEMPVSGKKLRVAVPIKCGFSEFLKWENDPKTNVSIPTGFCIDVFEQVINKLDYPLPFEYVSFGDPDGPADYDLLVRQVSLGMYDAAVGDITIVANRSRLVDFTLPYTESGMAMMVPFKKDERKNALFMKPLKTELWLAIGSSVIFTGFVVWVLEHRVNKEFRGPPYKQVGMIFWFIFSTFVFAHREKIISNLTKFVLIVWVFVVLVLTSSYTASLTSMLTVQQLQPTFKDISELIENGEYIGYQEGSFVGGLLKSRFNLSKFRRYSSYEEFDDALFKGSKNGGVAAIVDEPPYIRLALTKYCSKYAIVGPTYETPGFGFAFPKGSLLVPDVSSAILKLTEEGTISRIARNWFGEEAKCGERDGNTINDIHSLTLECFWGLFLIVGLSSTSALVIYLINFLHENRDALANVGSYWEKLVIMAKKFDEEKENSSSALNSRKTEAAAVGSEVSEEDDYASVALQFPATSIFHSPGGVFTPPDEEGFSTTESGTPFHHTFDTSQPFYITLNQD